MTDKTHTLRLIVADCVQNELRWQEPDVPVDLHRLGDRIADDVIRRIKAAGIKVEAA